MNSPSNKAVPDKCVLGISGWSGAGKTSLVKVLIPALKARGLSVSTIKHAHHKFDVDTPGKDSHAHRVAGASQVLVSSANRWALMTELRDAPEPSLDQLLEQLAPVDLVLVEGFKRETWFPKLEVYRQANGKEPLWPQEPSVIAVAKPLTDQLEAGAPATLDLDDVEAIADFIVDWRLHGSAHR